MNAVSIEKLYSGYNKSEILHGVDFAAAKDKITAIIGSNGSGKSTLLKSIFGLCNIHSGTISIMEKDITNTPTHRMINYGISYMAQRQNVFADLSIFENMKIAADRDDVSSGLEIFQELKKYGTKKAKVLSGGQRQLLAMAMVLFANPSVMLFDEPTAALSPKNADIILNKIQLIKEQKKCIVLVEQNVKRALDFCDTVYLFASGKIVYTGDPQKLLDDADLASKYLGL